MNAVIAVSNRVDKVSSYGGGIGYHLGKDLRIGVNADQQKRLTDVSQREYQGLRVGMSVTYGLQ